MITHNGKQVSIAMRNRKAINLIARNGKAIWDYAAHVLGIDAAAKAVILAEYGSVVWSDVRDYAKAHPAIVPFINQDPHLACSISPNSNKERWLANDNVAYIDVATSVNQDLSVEAEAILFAESEDQASLFSAGTSANAGFHLWAQGGKYGRYGTFTYGTQRDTGMTNMPLNQSFKARTEKNKVTYTLADGSVWYTKELVYRAFSYNTALRLFGLNYNGQLYAGCNLLGGMDNVKIWQGEELTLHLIPHLTADGQCGMLDLVSATFHPNANTEGQFTIAITDKE